MPRRTRKVQSMPESNGRTAYRFVVDDPKAAGDAVRQWLRKNDFKRTTRGGEQIYESVGPKGTHRFLCGIRGNKVLMYAWTPTRDGDSPIDVPPLTPSQSAYASRITPLLAILRTIGREFSPDDMESHGTNGRQAPFGIRSEEELPMPYFPEAGGSFSGQGRRRRTWDEFGEPSEEPNEWPGSAPSPVTRYTKPKPVDDGRSLLEPADVDIDDVMRTNPDRIPLRMPVKTAERFGDAAPAARRYDADKPVADPHEAASPVIEHGGTYDLGLDLDADADVARDAHDDADDAPVLPEGFKLAFVSDQHGNRYPVAYMVPPAQPASQTAADTQPQLAPDMSPSWQTITMPPADAAVPMPAESPAAAQTAATPDPEPIAMPAAPEPIVLPPAGTQEDEPLPDMPMSAIVDLDELDVHDEPEDAASSGTETIAVPDDDSFSTPQEPVYTPMPASEPAHDERYASPAEAQDQYAATPQEQYVPAPAPVADQYMPVAPVADMPGPQDRYALTAPDAREHATSPLSPAPEQYVADEPRQYMQPDAQEQYAPTPEPQPYAEPEAPQPEQYSPMPGEQYVPVPPVQQDAPDEVPVPFTPEAYVGPNGTTEEAQASADLFSGYEVGDNGPSWSESFKSSDDDGFDDVGAKQAPGYRPQDGGEAQGSVAQAYQMSQSVRQMPQDDMGQPVQPGQAPAYPQPSMDDFQSFAMQDDMQTMYPGAQGQGEQQGAFQQDFRQGGFPQQAPQQDVFDQQPMQQGLQNGFQQEFKQNDFQGQGMTFGEGYQQMPQDGGWDDFGEADTGNGQTQDEPEPDLKHGKKKKGKKQKRQKQPKQGSDDKQGGGIRSIMAIIGFVISVLSLPALYVASKNGAAPLAGIFALAGTTLDVVFGSNSKFRTLSVVGMFVSVACIILMLLLTFNVLVLPF